MALYGGEAGQHGRAIYSSATEWYIYIYAVMQCHQCRDPFLFFPLFYIIISYGILLFPFYPYMFSLSIDIL
jgi:hypothetical protein